MVATTLIDPLMITTDVELLRLPNDESPVAGDEICRRAADRTKDQGGAE
jgi:hypothetical protein